MFAFSLTDIDNSNKKTGGTMLMKNSWQKEWNRLTKKEVAYLHRASEKKTSALNHMVADKIPQKLQETLNIAFTKAFHLVFEKGTGIIEKTYNRDDKEQLFKQNRHAIEQKENRKSLRQFSKQANKSSQKNLLLSGIEGIGLGTLGIGLPDIPLFVGMLLKSIYEIALHYGYSYETTVEKFFILQLIQAALSNGESLIAKDVSINEFIQNKHLSSDYSQQIQIENTAAILSTELLYMKFLQGIPVIGAVGGVYDAVYLQKVQKYARLKYTRRFLYDLHEKKNH